MASCFEKKLDDIVDKYDESFAYSDFDYETPEKMSDLDGTRLEGFVNEVKEAMGEKAAGAFIMVGSASICDGDEFVIYFSAAWVDNGKVKIHPMVLNSSW